jgi:DNA-binding CsgD family transcriptional regulator
MICSGRVATTLMREIHRRPRPVLEPVEACLTARERQIVPLLAEGRSNKEIARELAISVATVKNHVRNILNKLGAGHRRAAVARVQANPALLRGAEAFVSERPAGGGAPFGRRSSAPPYRTGDLQWIRSSRGSDGRDAPGAD